MWRARTSCSLAHLLDRFVVDLLHRLVGDRGLAFRLQQRFHQQLVADEGERLLNRFCRRASWPRPPWRPGSRRRDRRPGSRAWRPAASAACWPTSSSAIGEVALADFDAVDLGDQRVLSCAAARRRRREQQRQRAAASAPRAGRRRRRRREAGENGTSWRYPWHGCAAQRRTAATCRAIDLAWQ